MSENGETTPDVTAESEAQWEKERKWPIFTVELEGDETEWVPRADTRYWEPEDPDDPNSKWKAKKDLPKDAKRSKAGDVILTARATVTCRAPSEEVARMMALRDNPDYHTVVNVEQKED